ncbi:hypothetical protein [Pseudomonas sp.]|uniref:hypothetical protein n=1 Tax=Pseudomonas sp. TaxID=306 RepID=UPI0026026274|nr:hypothetical protein [Pseudomonas sp.]
MEMQTMGLNAGKAREQMHQDGANTRAAMGERTAAQRLAMEGRRLAGEEETRGFQAAKRSGWRTPKKNICRRRRMKGAELRTSDWRR